MTHLSNDLLREMRDDGLGLFRGLRSVFLAGAIAGGCVLLGWMIYQVWRAM